MRLEKSGGWREAIQNACDSQVGLEVGQPVFVVDDPQLASLCPKRGEPLKSSIIGQVGEPLSFVTPVQFLQEMR